MRATSIRLLNFRSFVDSGAIELSSINVLIGANNAGKSTVLRGLQHLQEGLPDPIADVRVGTKQALIEIGLTEGRGVGNWPTNDSDEPFVFHVQIDSPDRRSGNNSASVTNRNNGRDGVNRLPSVEPNHFIIPYLSKRKAAAYSEDIREQNMLSITVDVSNLAAKLARLGNPGFPAHERYANACREILGFVVTAVPSANGQRPGIYLPDGQTIAIDQMGEGVPNIVQFLVHLAVSEGKLFVVEEPENDLHPRALKALLDLIVASADKNQFVVSTHSNIVVRHLCSVKDSLLYRIRPKHSTLPIESEITRIPANPDSRLAVLNELGYSLSDFKLWDGWVILEESSAERIIRDYLIPWFTPSLSRVRTIASGGATKVSATFEELNRLFLFAHLTPAYRHTAWVVVDGDKAGTEAITKIREKFSSYAPDHFHALSQPAFENYFPRNFHERATQVLRIPQEVERRQAKRELLSEVMQWLDADRRRGEESLAESASEVIDVLRQIETILTTQRR